MYFSNVIGLIIKTLMRLGQMFNVSTRHTYHWTTIVEVAQQPYTNDFQLGNGTIYNFGKSMRCWQSLVAYLIFFNIYSHPSLFLSLHSMAITEEYGKFNLKKKGKNLYFTWKYLWILQWNTWKMHNESKYFNLETIFDIYCETKR